MLAAHAFSLKTDKNSGARVNVRPLPGAERPDVQGRRWTTGVAYATAQNLAREVREYAALALAHD